ncbi:MAG: cyclase family protein [Firmicutes bacterium]|nr:cyclase family protein [Bacillota bacterium]
MNHEWIDLSHLISSSTLVYPGDPNLEITNRAGHQKDGFHMDVIKTAMHVGTHLDSPYHFIEKGFGIEEIPLPNVIGYANVIHVEIKNGVLNTEDIINAYSLLENQYPILLLNSKHGLLFNQEAYFTNCPSFEPSFFEFVMNHQIHTIGLDLPTIKYQGESPIQAHLDFLGQEITIIEGLNRLEDLHSEVFFAGLPLKIKGLDGSMIRAVAKNLN